jgi:predicted ATPase
LKQSCLQKIICILFLNLLFGLQVQPEATPQMNFKKAYRCVVTGGPGAGKTTTIQELNKNGYQIVDEVATFLIKKDLSEGKEHPAKNRDKFEKDNMNEQIKRERALDPEAIAFLDRGIIDGLKSPQDLIEFSKQSSYDVIFFLDFPSEDAYVQDEIRYETYEEALKNSVVLERTYKDLGYSSKIIKVPYMSVSKRVDFILEQLIGLE